MTFLHDTECGLSCYNCNRPDWSCYYMDIACQIKPENHFCPDCMKNPVNSDQITLTEFRNKCEGAPYDDEELAGIAVKIKNHELNLIAKRYLVAMHDFNEALNRISFEKG